MTEPLLRFFRYGHLPEELQATSREFHHLAHGMVESLPRCPERTVALRKLLESKDCAVRAALPADDADSRPPPTPVPGPGHSYLP